MKKIQTKDIVITSVFTALVYVATAFLHITIPMGGLLHLGDFVAILTALLFGPIVGAITGSLGMGLFNIVYAYPLSTILRTVIIKIFLGLVVGHTFRFIKKPRTKLPLEIIVLIAAAIGMMVNTALEFVFRIILPMLLDGYTFEGAVVHSVSRTPSAIIRAVVTVILVPIIYRYLHKVVENSSIFSQQGGNHDDFSI